MPAPRAALWPFLLGAGLGAVVSLTVDRKRRAAPPPPSVGRALDGVNDGFHAAYDRARQRTEHEAPVLVVLTDSLVLCRDGERDEVTFTPPVFHVIKSVAHAPMALFSVLHGEGDAPLREATRARVLALRASMSDAARRVEALVGEAEGRERLQAVLAASIAFVDRILGAGRSSPAELEAFARAMGPVLLGCTDDATRVQLAALNTHVADILARLEDGERRALHVVVTGNHQARVRSLAMQYFAALFGEAEGAEDHVAYGEGITDVDEALALVGTRRLDRAIAGAFFGDPSRLQRDVLGDAARERLKGIELPRAAEET